MKGTIISAVIALALIGGAFVIGADREEEAWVETPVEEGEMSLDSQVIEIVAKGGYTPRKISARAGIPTTLRVVTRGTFDCSSALTIPGIGYRANLPLSGATDIAIPPQTAGTSLEGTCQMGMYSFVIRFN